MTADQHQAAGQAMAMPPQPGPLAVIASLLAPARPAPRPSLPGAADLMPADAGWDAMVRWFDEQREWAELVATYADLNPDGTR